MRGMTRQEASFDRAGVRRAYDEVAASYAQYFPGTEPEAPLELAMIDAFVAALSSDAAATPDDSTRPRVLDAGCGAGRMSRLLADSGCAVEGVDLSPGMVDEARRARPDLSFEVASLDALPQDDVSFDGVMLWYSTIHTAPEAQPAIFAEAARVVRPGGHLLVAFQVGEGARDVAPAYARVGHDVELWRHLFTPNEVSAWATAAGFTETARMVRAAQGSERDPQAALLFTRHTSD